MRALVFILAFLLPSLALAQEDTTIRVGDLMAPWLEMLIGAVAVLITAVLGYLANLIRQKTGIDIEKARMETFQVALTNAAGLVIRRTTDSLANRTIDVRHPAVRQAIQYVNDAAPDAIDYFGLGADEIAEKIVAKLGIMSSQAVVVEERTQNELGIPT